MILPIILQGAELDLIDSNLRELTQEITQGGEAVTQARRDMLCSCVVEMLHAGGDPAAAVEDGSATALDMAMQAEDQEDLMFNPFFKALKG